MARLEFGTRRTVYYALLVVATTTLFTLTYNVGMAIWEGRPQPLYRSLEVVIQSFTTTGYGEDSPWQSLQMNVLVILMQLSGIGLILTAVDVFAVPWLRSALTPSAPEAIDDINDHVVVCGYTPRTEAFISELDARDREHVLVEADDEIARQLHDDGYRVIHGDPESTDTLENARIGSAIAVIADAGDDTSASIVLAARDADPDVRTITLITDPELVRYHRAAGADEVLSPRQLVGENLISEIPTAVTTEVEEGIALGEEFELAELSVEEGSYLCHRTFGDARIRDRFGVNVIGAWLNGDFETPVDPEATLEAGTRLLVVGTPDRIETLRDATETTVRRFPSQRIVLAGYGDSGKAVYDRLRDSNSQVTVLDIETDEEGIVDIVGDARDPAVLEEANVSEASAFILTIGDDTTAIFTTLIARELNPDLRIVVRANDAEAVKKLYRAGADYVQSLATISGRMLASTVFEDKEVIAYDKQISVVRLPAGDLAGTTVADADVRERTGCTVVAFQREDETIADFDPETFEIEPDDSLVVAGATDDVTRFERTFVHS
ncbi:TrkA family potassium uptake protein [Halopenitus sp. H-Gu1]|uniref:potassium channel family protein n=1 Tax=Halopenitus sp. H-Gu1 TaxID=3242697 RepID=UPI00359D6B63